MGLMNFFSGLGNTSFDDWISGAASARASVAETKSLDKWRAKNLPSYQMEGYRNAGLNPILVGDYSGGSGMVSASSGNYGAAVDAAQSAPTVASSAVDAARKFLNLGAETEEQKAKAEQAGYDALTARSRADLAEQQASIGAVRNAAEYEALTGVPTFGSGMPVEMRRNKAYNDLVQHYRNQIERGRYEQSLEHAIFEDFNSSARSVGSALKGSFGYKGRR